MGYGGRKPAYSTHDDTLRLMRVSFLHNPHNVDSSHLKDNEKKSKSPNACTEGVIFSDEGIEEESPYKDADYGTWNQNFDVFMIEVPPVVKQSKDVGDNQQWK